MQSKENTVVVVGTNGCDLSVLRQDSPWNWPARLAAPSLYIPTWDWDGSCHEVLTPANSIATAQVTSLAAVLKYIAPGKTPQEIIDHMSLYTEQAAFHPTDPGPSWVHNVIHFNDAITGMLYHREHDILGGGTGLIREYLEDRNAPGTTADSPKSMARVCGTYLQFDPGYVNCTPVAYDSIESNALSAIGSVANLIDNAQTGENGWSIVTNGEDNTQLDISCKDCSFIQYTGSGFSLGTYQVKRSPGHDEAKVTYTWNNVSTGEIWTGQGVDGVVKLESCQIIDRETVATRFQQIYSNNTPRYILLEGRVTNGDMEVWEHSNASQSWTKPMGGHFYLLMGTNSCNAVPGLCNHMEYVCIGGREVK